MSNQYQISSKNGFLSKYKAQLLAGIILLCAAIIRLGIMINTVDFHGISGGKIIQALEMINNPFAVSYWCPIHPPLHIFFIIIAIKFLGSVIIAPRLVSLIFGVMTIAVLYLFVKERFNKQIALYSIIGASLYSLHIIYSIIATSETSFHFFILLGMYCYEIFKKNNSNKNIILMGLFLGMASMCRYEGFLFIIFFMLCLFNKKKKLLIFMLFSLLLPLIWIVFNYFNFGGPFKFIESNNFIVPLQFNWIRQQGYNINLFYKLFYWPKVLMNTLGPWVFGFGVCGVVYSFLKQKDKVLPVLVICLFSVFIFFTIRETLYLQPRYSITLGLLLIPFSVYFFIEIINRLKSKIPGWTVLIMLWTMIIPIGGQVLASPLFMPAFAKDLTAYLQNNIDHSSNIILDHCGDEKFREPIKVFSEITPERFILIPFNFDAQGNYDVDKDELFKVIKLYSIKYLVYSPDGALGKVLDLDITSDIQARQGFLFTLKYKSGPYFVYSISKGDNVLQNM